MEGRASGRATWARAKCPSHKNLTDQPHRNHHHGTAHEQQKVDCVGLGKISPDPQQRRHHRIVWLEDPPGTCRPVEMGPKSTLERLRVSQHCVKEKKSWTAFSKPSPSSPLCFFPPPTDCCAPMPEFFSCQMRMRRLL